MKNPCDTNVVSILITIKDWNFDHFIACLDDTIKTIKWLLT